MIAYLKFNLDRLDDDLPNFELALKAGEMSAMLDEIKEYERKLRKYEPRKNIPTDEVAKELHDILYGE